MPNLCPSKIYQKLCQIKFANKIRQNVVVENKFTDFGKNAVAIQFEAQIGSKMSQKLHLQFSN
jgi:hypothetical protein